MPPNAYRVPSVGYPFFFKDFQCLACGHDAETKGWCVNPPSGTCGKSVGPAGNACPPLGKQKYYPSKLACILDNWKGEEADHPEKVLGTCKGVIDGFCVYTGIAGAPCRKGNNSQNGNNSAQYPAEDIQCLGTAPTHATDSKHWFPLAMPANHVDKSTSKNKWEWDNRTKDHGHCNKEDFDKKDLTCGPLRGVTLPHNQGTSPSSFRGRDHKYKTGDSTPCRCEIPPSVQWEKLKDGEPCEEKHGAGQCFSRKCAKEPVSGKFYCQSKNSGQPCTRDYQCKSNRCGPARAGSSHPRRCYVNSY